MDMTPEFIVLAFTLILAIVQIGAAGAARTAELGGKWNAGPRDGETPPPGNLAGQSRRLSEDGSAPGPLPRPAPMNRGIRPPIRPVNRLVQKVPPSRVSVHLTDTMPVLRVSYGRGSGGDGVTPQSRHATSRQE